MKVVQGGTALLVALLCGPHLHAQQITGNDLHQWLTETKKSQAGSEHDRQQANIARGYALGLSETLESSGIICMPQGVSRGQVMDIIYKMLEAQPQVRHMSANTLAAVALQDAYPCKPR